MGMMVQVARCVWSLTRATTWNLLFHDHGNHAPLVSTDNPTFVSTIVHNAYSSKLIMHNLV